MPNPARAKHTSSLLKSGDGSQTIALIFCAPKISCGNAEYTTNEKGRRRNEAVKEMGNPGFAGFPYVLLVPDAGLGAGHGGRRRHAGLPAVYPRKARRYTASLQDRRSKAPATNWDGYTRRWKNCLRPPTPSLSARCAIRNSISMRNSGARMLRYGWRRRYTGTSSPRKCSPCVRWGPNTATVRRGPYYKSLCSGKGSGCCFSSLKMRGSSIRGITAGAIVGEYQGKFFYNQAENAWYHSGTLGNYTAVPEGMRDPISDADMRRLIDSMANQ